MPMVRAAMRRRSRTSANASCCTACRSSIVSGIASADNFRAAAAWALRAGGYAPRPLLGLLQSPLAPRSQELSAALSAESPFGASCVEQAGCVLARLRVTK